YVPALQYILSVFPGKLSAYVLDGEVSYRALISDYSGLSWGLAGNIVSESLFYFGDGFIFSIIFLFLTSIVYYNGYTIFIMPFFIMN
ncbi:hypothetical protein ACS2Q8_28975, partial [Bacillus cereus group sp. Bce007]